MSGIDRFLASQIDLLADVGLEYQQRSEESDKTRRDCVLVSRYLSIRANNLWLRWRPPRQSKPSIRHDAVDPRAIHRQQPLPGPGFGMAASAASFASARLDEVTKSYKWQTS